MWMGYDLTLPNQIAHKGATLKKRGSFCGYKQEVAPWYTVDFQLFSVHKWARAAARNSLGRPVDSRRLCLPQRSNAGIMNNG